MISTHDSRRVHSNNCYRTPLRSAYLPSPTLRSHQWCTSMPTLAACSGASRILDRRADPQSSLWCHAPLSGTTQSCYRYIWSTLTPLLWHQPSRTTLQTLYCRQPSFSGCRRQDLERIAGQSRLHNVITVLSAPSEDIILPSIFLVASTAVDLAVVDIILKPLKTND